MESVENLTRQLKICLEPFLCWTNGQTNKYYNFLTDLHIHCEVSKNYYLSRFF